MRKGTITTLTSAQVEAHFLFPSFECTIWLLYDVYSVFSSSTSSRSQLLLHAAVHWCDRTLASISLALAAVLALSCPVSPSACGLCAFERRELAGEFSWLLVPKIEQVVSSNTSFAYCCFCHCRDCCRTRLPQLQRKTRLSTLHKKYNKWAGSQTEGDQWCPWIFLWTLWLRPTSDACRKRFK